jgi:hypothetical protein
MSVQIRLGKDVNLSSHTEYELQVSSPQGQFKFLRRYSALRALHTALSKEVKVRLPPFPPKKVFGKMKPEFVSQRRKQLLEYFQQVTQFTEVQSSEVFQTFISAKDRSFQRSASEPLQTTETSSPLHRRANSQETEPKLLDNKVLGRIVDQAVTGFINLGCKPAPIEARDAQEKQLEHVQLVKSLRLAVVWRTASLTQVEIADLPFAQVSVQREWLIAEAAEVSQALRSAEMEASDVIFKLN